MQSEQHPSQAPGRTTEDHRLRRGQEVSQHEAHLKEVHAKAEQASRSVMHPESFDPEWRYYHGAWGG